MFTTAPTLCSRSFYACYRTSAGSARSDPPMAGGQRVARRRRPHAHHLRRQRHLRQLRGAVSAGALASSERAFPRRAFVTFWAGGHPRFSRGRRFAQTRGVPAHNRLHDGLIAPSCVPPPACTVMILKQSLQRLRCDYLNQLPPAICARATTAAPRRPRT